MDLCLEHEDIITGDGRILECLWCLQLADHDGPCRFETFTGEIATHQP